MFTECLLRCAMRACFISGSSALRPKSRGKACILRLSRIGVFHILGAIPNAFETRHVSTQASYMKASMSALLAAGYLVLAACTPFSAYRPNIDLRGADLNQYEHDMNDCEARAAGESFAWGNPIAECMARRGYKILHTY
jgi:hypothetical protein